MGKFHRFQRVFSRKNTHNQDTDDSGVSSGCYSGDSNSSVRVLSEDEQGYVTCSSDPLELAQKCGAPSNTAHVQKDLAQLQLDERCDYLSPKEVGPAPTIEEESVYDVPVLTEKSDKSRKPRNPDKKSKKKEDSSSETKQKQKILRRDASYRNVEIRKKMQETPNVKKDPLPPVPLEVPAEFLKKVRDFDCGEYDDLESIRRKTQFSRDENKVRKIDDHLKQVTMPEHIYASIAEVPADLILLSKEDIADCLRLLGMVDRQQKFLDENIDGFLLMNLNEKALGQIGLNDMEICKVMAFVKGWRPGATTASTLQRRKDESDTLQREKYSDTLPRKELADSGCHMDEALSVYDVPKN